MLRFLRKTIKNKYNYCDILTFPWGLNTLAKEFSAATSIMQSTSKKLSTLVSGKV